MVSTSVTTPYQTAMPYVRTALSKWIDEYTAQRQASYDLYDDLYKNSPAAGQYMIRGSNDKPVFMPTAKGLINNLGRYVGRDWGYSAETIDEDGNVVALTAESADIEDYKAVLDAVDQFFRRNNLTAAFQESKVEFLRRGDWVWYLSADPLKAEGERLSIAPVDPRRFRVIQDDPEDASRVTGAWLFEEATDPKDDSKMVVKVQEWLKPSSPAYPGADGSTNITYSVTLYDQEDWLDEYGDLSPDAKVNSILVPVAELEGIPQLPLYHIKNNAETDNPYGISDLEGLESIIAGISQTVSDEDWAVSTMGVGMFVSKGNGSPVDENGIPVPWRLGPGQVTEIGPDDANTKRDFKKIEGINSVQPMQDHAKLLKDAARETVALSEVAVGQDSTNASGIALALKLQPTFDAADSKDLTINGVMTQLLYDLRYWFQQYEGLDITTLRLTSTTSKEGRVPFDREARFSELMDLLSAGVVSPEYVQQVLNDEFGYRIPIGSIAGATAGGPGADEDAAVSSRADSELADEA